MHQNHKRFIYLLIAAMMAFGISCGSSDSSDKKQSEDTYTFKNVPSKYSVTIPASLKNADVPENPAKKKSMFTALKNRNKAVAEPEDETVQSEAYAQLQREVNDMRQSLQQFELNFIVIDAAWDQIMAQLGSNTNVTINEGTLEVPFTQAMYNRILEIFPEALEAGFPLVIGENIPFPDLKVTIDGTAADGYKYTFEYSGYNEEYSEDWAQTIKWNNEKTKVYLTYTGTGSDQDGDYNYSSVLTYDQESKISTDIFNYGQSGNVSTHNIMMQETGEANNEIIFNEKSTYNSDDFSYSFELKAKADDNGGLVWQKFEESGSSWYFKEEFDGGGNLLAKSVSNDGENWVAELGDTVVDMGDDTSYVVESRKLAIDSSNKTILETAAASYPDVVAIGQFPFMVFSAGTTETNVQQGIGAIGYGFYDIAKHELLDSSYWGSSGQLTGALVYIAVNNNDTGLIEFVQVAGLTVAASEK